MLPRRGKAGLTIKEVAETDKLTHKSTDFFTVTNEIAGVEEIANFTFVRTAFSLQTNLVERVSTPIVGSNTVYVLSLADRIPPETPEFEQVKAEVAEQAQTYYVGQKLFEKATEIRDALTKAMTSNTNFAGVAANYSLSVTSAPPIVLQTVDMRCADPINRVIVENVRHYGKGDVTEVLNAGEDVLIAYIRDRKTADAASYATDSKGIRNELLRIRQPAVAADYEDYLKKELRIESNIKYETDEETDG